MRNSSNIPLSPLPRSFYTRPTLRVAKELLGKLFVRVFDDGIMAGRIVEVEAYCMNDPASHSYRGRTQRNDVMFWEGGHLYVYFTYGMHYCANVVTNVEGQGEAVLIRAVEPLLGLEHMLKNRFSRPRTLTSNHLLNLTNGPAKVCQAFSITKAENGYDLTNSPIFLTEPLTNQKFSICSTSRIGIRNGVEKKWRFYMKNNPWVSI